MKNENPYAASTEQPANNASFRRANTLLAVYYSFPSIVGGLVSAAIGVAAFIGAIMHIQQSAAALVAVPFGIAGLALAIRQFRTAWMLTREGWNSTNRKIQLPRPASLWGDFAGSEPAPRRKLPDAFDPDQIR